MATLNEFLDFYPSKNTKRVYKSGIFKFLEVVYGISRKGQRLSKKERIKLEELADQYFNEERNYSKDLLNFAVSLNDNDSPPKSAKTYFASVKEFLFHNDIELSYRDLKSIKRKLPKGNARTEELDLDIATITQIIEHMDIKGKALILLLGSSGMRIGEALQIELDDIKMETTPVSIHIRGDYTKNGMQRYTFISKEAKTTLDEWLKVRESYLKSAQNRNKGLIKNGKGNAKNKNDNRLFPFSYSVVEQLWENALTKSENLSYDKSTGRKQLRIHQLRKFFRSQLALGCPVEIVEALLGHEGYLTDAYRRYTKAQMGEHYLKHEHLLNITMPQDIKEMQSEFKNELNNNRKLLEDLFIENKDLKNRLSVMEDDSSKFHYILQCLIEGKQPEKLTFVNGKLVFTDA